MTFNVRLTGYRGVVQTRVIQPRQDSYDSSYLLSQPYEFSLVATSAGNTPITIGPSGLITWQDYSLLVLVEIPVGSAIAYEINNPNLQLIPSPVSPTLWGTQRIAWGPGWSLIFVEAGDFPRAGIDLVSEAGPFLTSETGTQLVTP